MRLYPAIDIIEGKTVRLEQGRYDRKLTLTDQYVLDLRPDAARLLDRRVALALAILLDTGESR